MVLPTMVPPSAFLSIGWSTTLTSDSRSRRRRSFGFFTPLGAPWLVLLASMTPAEESVVLRSVGIWEAPREIICLRLVAAPLWAGFQFYGNSLEFPSCVPYDRPFRVRIGGNSLISLPAFTARILGTGHPCGAAPKIFRASPRLRGFPTGFGPPESQTALQTSPRGSPTIDGHFISQRLITAERKINGGSSVRRRNRARGREPSGAVHG